MPEPKILLFDIETAPIILYSWALGNEVWDPKFIRRNWFVLCWSAKWLGDKKVINSSLPKFRGYKNLPNKTQKNIDKGVMKELWELLDECDVAIAHNLKSFDRKKANTRFIINGMKPPSPYHMVDTLSIARSEFKFTSNKLGYIAKKLCVSQKMETGGFDLWLGCEDGDKGCWDKMIKYCDQDVRALEDVYLEERPYIKNHPNLNVIHDDESCPKCGHKENVKDGLRYTNSGVFQKYRCKGCGGSMKQRMDGGKVTNAN
jgi:hypothetical protein